MAAHLQQRQHPGRRVGRCQLAGVQAQLGPLGHLVGRADAGEVGQLADFRARVKTLRVARRAGGKRGAQVDLDETLGADALARRGTVRGAWRDHRGEHHQAGLVGEAGDLGNAADVLGAVGIGKA